MKSHRLSNGHRDSLRKHYYTDESDRQLITNYTIVVYLIPSDEPLLC